MPADKQGRSSIWFSWNVRKVAGSALSGFGTRSAASCPSYRPTSCGIGGAQTKQPLIGIIRQLIQKVVIASTPRRQPPALEVHGRIASILAAMETAQFIEAKFKAMVEQDVFGAPAVR